MQTSQQAKQYNYPSYLTIEINLIQKNIADAPVMIISFISIR
jgi:hypothetical protein